MKLTFKKISNLFNRIYFRGGRISYSQNGEDLIVDCIFEGKKRGTYVDVGANHPTKSSNTYLFYRKGWNGINIDAQTETIEKFNKSRVRDLNIALGVNDYEGFMDFYIFKESSYNTFLKESVDAISKISPLLRVEKVNVCPLSKVFNQHDIKQIDFMSVDVEGLDINVLKSNDWNIQRPLVIIIEEFQHGNDLKYSETYKFLSNINYIHFCQTVTNAIYLDRDYYSKRFKLS